MSKGSLVYADQASLHYRGILGMLETERPTLKFQFEGTMITPKNILKNLPQFCVLSN